MCRRINFCFSFYFCEFRLIIVYVDLEAFAFVESLMKLLIRSDFLLLQPKYPRNPAPGPHITRYILREDWKFVSIMGNRQSKHFPRTRGNKSKDFPWNWAPVGWILLLILFSILGLAPGQVKISQMDFRGLGTYFTSNLSLYYKTKNPYTIHERFLSLTLVQVKACFQTFVQVCSFYK